VPVVSGRLEEGLRLSGGKRLTLARLRPRDADQPGDVAPDQFVMHSILEGGAQRRVRVLHGSGSNARVTQPVQEQAHIPGGELVQPLRSQAGDEMPVDVEPVVVER
jgi:hypothetical protein